MLAPAAQGRSEMLAFEAKRFARTGASVRHEFDGPIRWRNILALCDKLQKQLSASKVTKLAKSSKLQVHWNPILLPMSFPLRLPDQLKQHLRALRKGCGLTQARLGVLVGVKQARIAEIEANPGAVSLDQLTKVLAALGGTLHLHSADVAAPSTPRVIAPAQVSRRKAFVAMATKTSGSSPAHSGQIIGAPVQRKETAASKAALRTGVVIRPKKGTW